MKMTNLKKNLVGGHKKILFILVFLLLSKTSNCFQIHDYQTEKFIEKIILEIISVNKYSKKINFKIIQDDFPNAFVNENNTLFLSTGLIVHSPDYVSFLAVVAHEIGHLEKYHVAERKKEISDLKKINSIGNIVAIAGSMLIEEPDLINTIILNQTTIKNFFIKFSQNQEKEADLYAVNTLNKLKLSTKSIKEFLNILDDKTKFNIMDDELKKFSTHPMFQERHEIIDINNTALDSKIFDSNLQNDFNYIKAKFIAYTHSNLFVKLTGDVRVYYESINNALSGNLLSSLRKINYLIKKYNNYYFIETKADILLSYGYNKEAIDFYNKALIKLPNNNYIKFNIFINSNFNIKNKKKLLKIFYQNSDLINIFPQNKILLSKYYNLSKKLNLEDWIIFFEILLNNENNKTTDLNKLKNKDIDNNLKKLIKIYI